MSCLPDNIISCRFNLEYDLSQNRIMAKGDQSLLWSSSFCKALGALLVSVYVEGSSDEALEGAVESLTD